MREIEESTGVTPPALLNRPELPWYLYHYLEIFHVLSRARNVHEVSQPIQVSEVLALLKDCGGFTSDERFRFLLLIQELDGVFLDYRTNKKRRPSPDKEEPQSK